MATPTLRCTASVYQEGDVTAQAAWSAADSFRLGMDVPVTASDAVDFPSPGVPRALRVANVYIRADYVSPRWGRMRSIAPHAYAVDPASGAIPLSYVSGTAGQGGVTVEIIDGEGMGKRAVTIDNGSYMIEFQRMNAPFTARASKPGYMPDVKVHPGIVDDMYGYPMNSYLHFTLNPAQ